MSAPESGPAVTIKWKMETDHKARLSLARYRDDLISWFSLADDATDQQIVDALVDARHMPPMFQTALEEWSDESTECGWLIDDDYDIELHGIDSTGRTT